MFKVLVIAYYFPPLGLSGVQRTLKFVKYMGDFNWHATVITTGSVGYYAHDSQLLAEAENTGADIVRTKGRGPNTLLSKYGTVKMPKESFRKALSTLSKIFFIPDNKIAWSHQAYLMAKNLISNEKFDIIYVTIPPFSAFPIAAKLKKKFEIPLFVDYRDLWTGNQFAFYPTVYHKHKHKKLEDHSLRASDKIIVVNRKIKEELLQKFKFLNFNDIMIIPHGYDKADFEAVKLFPNTNGKMKITYSGIFYEQITPRYLLKAFKEISIERPDIASNIELHFVGHFRKENRRLVKKYHLEEYVFEYGYLEHHESIKRIISSDVLWVMLPNTKNMDKVSAGKLFEYFGARKPIIASVPDGASKTASEKYGASFIVEPKNVKELKETIYKVHNLFQTNKLPVPNEEFVLKHDRKSLTELLIKEFQFFLKAEI